MYGWDTSQNWPGLLSAYSRHLLEWVEVIDVEYTQEITITAACDSDTIYRIKHRMASDNQGGAEYLLLENRYACGPDLKLLHDYKDRQGIAVWYVDHTMLLGQNAGRDVVGYKTSKPPTDPAWPAVHSRVQLLQGDGEFEMENNKNRGNENDMLRVDTSGSRYRAFKMSNTGVFMNDGTTTRPYPNTKSIAHCE
jgi:hypothetical protein